MNDQHFEGHQESGRDTETERESVIGWRRPRPDEQGALPAAPIADEFENQSRIRNEEPGAKHQQRSRDEVDTAHIKILRKLALLVERLC
jgi:hypothetical protein